MRSLKLLKMYESLDYCRLCKKLLYSKEIYCFQCIMCKGYDSLPVTFFRHGKSETDCSWDYSWTSVIASQHSGWQAPILSFNSLSMPYNFRDGCFMVCVAGFLPSVPGNSSKRWEDLGIEAAFKCRALKVPSCSGVIAYSWCVGSVISQPCKLCHLLIPPSRVADATQPSCLLAVKGTLKFFTTKNERSLKLPEKCVWMPDQMSES